MQIKDVKKHKIAGREFVLFRDEYGVIRANHKNCPHMGVDLSYGYVDKQCIVCPMHGKRVKSNQKHPVFVEETNNVIFVWIGDLEHGKPPITISNLFIQNDMETGQINNLGHLTHKLGGHLVDYAEHLLDVHHAPYIHGVHIDPIQNGLKTTKYSFKTSFSLRETGNIPIFTYATPTFGNIKYTDDAHVYIMFIVRDVGDIEMIIMPGWEGSWSVSKIFRSVLMTIYTYIDFSDEAAYFTTKNHCTRNLNPSEKPMDDFRDWFRTNFFNKSQLDMFHQRQKDHCRRITLNDW